MQTSTSSANIYNLAVGSGGLSVLGNFTINGTTIYNTPTFTISAGTPLVSGQTAQFGAFRTLNNLASGTAANSYMRWNETNSRWDATGNSYTGNYSNLLLASDLSDSISTTSSTTAASATAVKTANDRAQAAYNSQNTTLTYAQAGYVAQNITASFANAAFTQANAWNTFYTNGGTITGDVGITGNLFVNGTTSYINVATYQTVDSLIELAANNLSDTIDIGFYGQYVSFGTKYSGLARKAAGNYVLFQGVQANPTGNNIGIIVPANYATLSANITAGSVTASQAIGIASGGTNANSFTADTITLFNGTSISSLTNPTV
jgi:hypothetical protein